MLDELERLERAATPGPWVDVDPHNIRHAEPNIYAGDQEIADVFSSTADSALVCAARNALPALLRVARAAQKARRLSARLDELAAALEADLNDVETQTAYELLSSDEVEALVALDAALAALEGRRDA